MFLLISGVIVLSLLVGGSFYVYKNSSNQTSNSSDKPSKKEKKPTLPPDSPPLDQPKNPLPQPDPVKNDKTELKVFWTGVFAGHDEYWDYWIFSEKEDKPNCQWFLIAKNNPLFQGKKLNQEGSLITLSYSENEVVKKVEKTYPNGDPQLAVLESGFKLVPDSPWQDDPSFRGNYEKGNDAQEKVQFLEKNANGSKEHLIFNNYFADENGRKPSILKIFYITTDSLLAKQLINFEPQKLQKGKKFILGFSKAAEYDKVLNCWYFDSSCDRKIWIDEID